MTNEEREKAPGSPEAKAAGCMCPAIDNHHGDGYFFADGQRQFVIRQDCPMHGWSEKGIK